MSRSQERMPDWLPQLLITLLVMTSRPVWWSPVSSYLQSLKYDISSKIKGPELVDDSLYSWELIEPQRFPKEESKLVLAAQEGSIDLYVCTAKGSEDEPRIGKTVDGKCNLPLYKGAIKDGDYLELKSSRKELPVDFPYYKVLTVRPEIATHEWVERDFERLDSGNALKDLSSFKILSNGKEFTVCRAFYKDKNNKSHRGAWHAGVLEGNTNDGYICAFPYGGWVGFSPNRDSRSLKEPYDSPEQSKIHILAIKPRSK